MLGIKVNGRFLDLKPEQSIESERKSPFFSIEEAFGEGTPTPISFIYTENNCIALEWIFQYHTKRQKKKIQVEVYDENGFFCLATLLIQTGRMNISRVEDSEVTGNLIFGASQFLQLADGKLLSDLKLGGPRTFNFTTTNPIDGSNGYWQHFHETWTNATIPYVFQPVRNEDYYGEAGTVEWINKLGTSAHLQYDFFSPLVPMIRLKYLLECIFTEFGFTVDFSGLNDTEWERMIMLNLTKVDWVTSSLNNQNNLVASPKATIQINLSRHVPQKKTITDFIIQLFGRYGWAPVFDIVRKKVTIVAGKELGKRARKDWTMYAEPIIEDDFSEDSKIFAFKNEIDSNDKFPEAGDFTNAKYGPPVLSKRNLPPANYSVSDRIVFVYNENRYYQVQLDDTTNQYVWAVFSDNIFDDEPAKATDTISTTVSTLPCYFSLYRSIGGIDYYGVFPVMKQEYNSDMSYRLLVYQGLVEETLENGVMTGPYFYPHATNCRNDRGGPIMDWSNTYHQVVPTNGEDFGIIPYWWKWFLWLLQAGEEDEIKLWLPRHELINYKWDDEILIGNISYVIKSLLQPLPYKGFVVAKMKRFVKQIPISNSVAAVVTGVIYARLSIANITSEQEGFLTIHYCDVHVDLYSDQAGTIPYTPATPLVVYVRTTVTKDGSFYSEVQDFYQIDSSSKTILTHQYSTAGVGTNVSIQYVYSLDPSGANDYLII